VGGKDGQKSSCLATDSCLWGGKIKNKQILEKQQLTLTILPIKSIIEIFAHRLNVH
jgi:hypothetical protein